jgi:hypothetical protein
MQRLKGTLKNETAVMSDRISVAAIFVAALGGSRQSWNAHRSPLRAVVGSAAAEPILLG